LAAVLFAAYTVVNGAAGAAAQPPAAQV